MLCSVLEVNHHLCLYAVLMLPLEMQVDPETDEQSACASSLLRRLAPAPAHDNRWSSYFFRLQRSRRRTKCGQTWASASSPRADLASSPNGETKRTPWPARRSVRPAGPPTTSKHSTTHLPPPPPASSTQQSLALHEKKKKKKMGCVTTVWRCLHFLLQHVKETTSAGRERAMYNPYGVVRLIGWFGIDWGRLQVSPRHCRPAAALPPPHLHPAPAPRQPQQMSQGKPWPRRSKKDPHLLLLVHRRVARCHLLLLPLVHVEALLIERMRTLCRVIHPGRWLRFGWC